MFKIILILFLCFPAFGQMNRNRRGQNYELLSGIRGTKDNKKFWDKKYSDQSYVFGKSPAKFLARNYNYIPEGSRILDMGMGEGRNAVFMARKGYKVTGIDISSVAIKKARSLAREFGVRIDAVVATMNKYKIQPGTLDAILCFYYVDRTLNEKMVQWLKPGGILIYEAHTDLQRQVKGQEHYDKRYLLRQGELLHMFPNMKILKYEEPLHSGEFTSSIILQKPSK